VRYSSLAPSEDVNFLSVTVIVSLLITTPEGMYGQDAGRRATSQGDIDPGCKSSTIIIETRGSPSGLIDAIRRSNVILDGTVSSLLPSASVGISLETGAAINVATVFKGTVPANADTTLLAQMGGRMGNCKVTIHHDTLVVPGERYILFLIPDTRTAVPNTSGLARYWPIGLSGKVRVDGGLIHISPDVSSGWKALDGQNVNAFIETLKARIRQPYSDDDKKLPINPAPPK
jgi:hypothetical protein